MYIVNYNVNQKYCLFIEGKDFIEQSTSIISNDNKIARKKFVLNSKDIKSINNNIIQVCTFNISNNDSTNIYDKDKYKYNNEEIIPIFYPYMFEVYNNNISFYRVKTPSYYNVFEDGIIYIDNLFYFMDHSKKELFFNFISAMTKVNERTLMSYVSAMKTNTLQYHKRCNSMNNNNKQLYKYNSIYRFFFLKHNLTQMYENEMIRNNNTNQEIQLDKLKTCVELFNDVKYKLQCFTDVKRFWHIFDKLMKQVFVVDKTLCIKKILPKHKHLGSFIKDICVLCTTNKNTNLHNNEILIQKMVQLDNKLGVL